ncbi:hypothetical protein evm_008369 [Chilo suppressalis]|nr:hypothetical protein evm_008369 [Chilo suppressalis]
MMYTPNTSFKLASSASEQNVYFTYVCLVNDVIPNSISNCQPGSYGYIDGDNEEIDQEETPIQVERSKAVHELVENKDNHAKDNDFNENDPKVTTTSQDDENEQYETEDTDELNGNPNILKLTKMKWLSEEQCVSPDSSSPSLSPNMSSTSICSIESEDQLDQCISVNDKYLSTILRLDREHNMFGLSKIAIVGSQPSRKIRKDDDKPVFPQTAIVQICCGKGCCRNMSKTDLPSSLKCGGCRSCCIAPICYGSCFQPCTIAPSCQKVYPSQCTAPDRECCCKACTPRKCVIDCSTYYGMKVAVRRKPKYEPSPVELTPRSSSVLQKPFAARSCHHIPRCVPPSAGFPYLMPCFWPARPSAPCSVPARCFHNPPCIAPRKRRPPKMANDICPPRCDETQSKCQNFSCLGVSVFIEYILLL